jgi:hypothetical protein
MFKINGFRVVFKHGEKKDYTECYIINESGVIVSTGASYCSRSDEFCRRIGRKLSLERALRSFDRPVRTKLWDAYFAKSPKSRQ